MEDRSRELVSRPDGEEKRSISWRVHRPGGLLQPEPVQPGKELAQLRTVHPPQSVELESLRNPCNQCRAMSLGSHEEEMNLS